MTFIAADGTVVGDSAETLAGVAAMENHHDRPEVVAARAAGIGQSRRYSATLKIDMLYVAVAVHHPAIAFVRVALPVTDVRHQLQSVLMATLAALGVALLGGAAMAWIFSGADRPPRPRGGRDRAALPERRHDTAASRLRRR